MHCCSAVTVKNTENAEVRVIYDAKQVISGLRAPIVKDVEVIDIIYISLACVSSWSTFSFMKHQHTYIHI